MQSRGAIVCARTLMDYMSEFKESELKGKDLERAVEYPDPQQNDS